MDEGGFDHEAIARAIRAHKPELLATLRNDVRRSLLALTPGQALSLRLLRGDVEVRTLAPDVSATYGGALIAFCRGKQYDGYLVDSSVTPRVSGVVEASLLAFFTSEATAKAVSDAIVQELQSKAAVGTVLQGRLAEEKDWLSHELATLQNFDVSYSIAGQLVDVTAQQIHEFFRGAVGKQMMAVIGKVMATSSGKALLIKTMNVAIAKVMASAALKSALLTAIKKVGIGILIKTAIGKALVALLAVVGIAHVPLLWIILPILAGFLVYEYNTFPAKLAERIPDEVVRIVDSKFGELSDTVARGTALSIMDEVVKELTKVRLASS
jgi:hypothetical protein